jgi:hypothetical protein
MGSIIAQWRNWRAWRDWRSVDWPAPLTRTEMRLGADDQYGEVAAVVARLLKRWPRGECDPIDSISLGSKFPKMVHVPIRPHYLHTPNAALLHHWR